jgi:hypothetical protein
MARFDISAEDSGRYSNTVSLGGSECNQSGPLETRQIQDETSSSLRLLLSRCFQRDFQISNEPGVFAFAGFFVRLPQ